MDTSKRSREGDDLPPVPNKRAAAEGCSAAESATLLTTTPETGHGTGEEGSGSLGAGIALHHAEHPGLALGLGTPPAQTHLPPLLLADHGIVIDKPPLLPHVASGRPDSAQEIMEMIKFAQSLQDFDTPATKPAGTAPSSITAPTTSHAVKWPMDWKFHDLVLLIRDGTVPAADALAHFFLEALAIATELHSSVGLAADDRGNNILHHLVQWPLVGPHARTGPGDMAPLHDKVTGLIHQAVKLGASLSSPNIDGRTPAHVALLFGSAITLKAVLELGHDRSINAQKQPLLHLLAAQPAHLYDTLYARTLGRGTAEQLTLKADISSKLYLLLHVRNAGDPRERWSFKAGPAFPHVAGCMSALEIAQATRQPLLAAQIYNVYKSLNKIDEDHRGALRVQELLKAAGTSPTSLDTAHRPALDSSVLSATEFAAQMKTVPQPEQPPQTQPVPAMGPAVAAVAPTQEAGASGSVDAIATAADEEEATSRE